MFCVQRNKQRYIKALQMKRLEDLTCSSHCDPFAFAEFLLLHMCHSSACRMVYNAIQLNAYDVLSSLKLKTL